MEFYQGECELAVADGEGGSELRTYLVEFYGESGLAIHQDTRGLSVWKVSQTETGRVIYHARDRDNAVIAVKVLAEIVDWTLPKKEIQETIRQKSRAKKQDDIFEWLDKQVEKAVK